MPPRIYPKCISLKAALAVPKKSCKVLMMMKAAKLGWSREKAGLDKEQGQEGQKQGRSKAEVGTGQE